MPFRNEENKMKIKKSLIKRIHVQQKNIKANHKDKGKRPVFSVRTSKGTFHGSLIKIKGPSELIYGGQSPLSCGARAWITTRAEVEIS